VRGAWLAERTGRLHSAGVSSGQESLTWPGLEFNQGVEARHARGGDGDLEEGKLVPGAAAGKAAESKCESPETSGPAGH